MSYDVDDDTGDAEVRHPGYCVLWGRNRARSHLVKQRWLGTGKAWNLTSQGASSLPGSSFNRQCHLVPLEDQWEVGSWGWGWGLLMVHLGPTPLTCRTKATVSTQQAVKQVEKPRRSRNLLPKSSTTTTWKGRGPRKAGRFRSSKPYQTHPCPEPPLLEAPGPSGTPRTPLLRSSCEGSPGVVIPKWPVGPSTAQSRGPISSCHVMALALGVASKKWRAAPHRAGEAAPQQEGLSSEEGPEDAQEGTRGVSLPQTRAASSARTPSLEMPSADGQLMGLGPQGTHGAHGHHHVDRPRARRHILDVTVVHPRAPVDLVCVVVDLEGKPRGWWGWPGPGLDAARCPWPPAAPLPHSLLTAAGQP